LLKARRGGAQTIGCLDYSTSVLWTSFPVHREDCVFRPRHEQELLMSSSRVAVFIAVTLAVALGLGRQASTAIASDAYAPAATQWSDSRVDVFVRGRDNNIYHRYFLNGWSAWEWLGSPPGGAQSAPAATQPGSDIYSLFVRGRDGLYHKYWNPSTGTWVGWGLVPNTGNIVSAPAATYGRDPNPDVFYTGTDGSVYHVFWDPTAGWSTPGSLGGAVLGAPGASTSGAGVLNVFVRGTDNHVYHKYSPGPFQWIGWGGVPNSTTTDSPGASGTADSFSVWFRGTDGGEWNSYWTSTTGWVTGRIPNTVPASGIAVTNPHLGATSNANTYYYGADGNYYHVYWTPSTGWVGPGSIGAPPIFADGTLLRAAGSPAVYYYESGERYLIPSAAVAEAEGLDLSRVVTVPQPQLDQIQNGGDITSQDLEGVTSIDDGTASIASSGWDYWDTDVFDFDSQNAKARASGTVRWYRGAGTIGPLHYKGFRHRVQIAAGSKVEALQPVGCIWAKVRFGWITGGVSLPNPDAAISGAETDTGFAVKCRHAGEDRPDPIKLGGISYARGLLQSVTVTICNSADRADGPNYNCSNHKMNFQDG
jgi:hypothetical protein